ncbi:MAG: UvrB/UvrC motif-containing protein [Verrucomicrobiae bacterium]|nr:UvrB/UvrC motif-containing protein [Verrucomicrobiae bacterium]
MKDLDYILEEWPFEPGARQARLIRGRDGQMKLQLRLDLGILQMNMEGRPDGKKPHNHESLLDYYEDVENKKNSVGEELKLGPDACYQLQQEGAQYYYRFLALFQLQDYDAAGLDMERNLRLFDFVIEHVEKPDLAVVFQQFYPSALMMLARVRGMKALREKNFNQAIKQAEWGIEQIRLFARESLPPEGAEEYMEDSREISALESWVHELRENRPLTPIEKLRQQMAEAIAREDFERAARLRDALRELE